MERSTDDLKRRVRKTLHSTSRRTARNAVHRRKQHHMHRDSHDSHDSDRHPRGEHGRGRHGRHRARRGAIVGAVLTLLDERPMHGYELITELEERSEGRWRPSPGTMYPALKRMSARGLITSEEIDGKRQFELTDTGREHLALHREERGEDAADPWDEQHTGGRGDLRSSVAELIGQARQIGRFGSAEQIERARTVFDDAKRQLYAILAEPTSDGASDDIDDAVEASNETPASD